MAIQLNFRSVLERALTWAEMDSNFSKIKEAVDTLQGNNPTASKSAVVDLALGVNTYNHALGKKARFVNFFLANGTSTEYNWKRNADDPDNKIDITVPEGTPARELLNTEINIQAL